MNFFYLKCAASIFIISLLSACKKESLPSQKPLTATEITRTKSVQQPGGCRLTSIESYFGNEYYTYNTEGLVDIWELTAFGGYFRLIYNEKGVQTGAEFYSNGQLISRVEFIYDEKNVVKEIWYDGNSSTISDEVYYTFNAKGEIVKSQSFIQDYYTVYEYTPDGNVSRWILYLGGAPLYKFEYTYGFHHKNPNRASNGIDNGFPYSNGAVLKNKWLSSSEKFSFYDNGTEIFLEDQDPSKTIVITSQENYVGSITYYETLNDGWVPFNYSYENCGSDNGSSSAKIIAGKSKDYTSAIKRLLQKGSGKTMKQKIAEFKRNYK